MQLNSILIEIEKYILFENSFFFLKKMFLLLMMGNSALFLYFYQYIQQNIGLIPFDVVNIP